MRTFAQFLESKKKIKNSKGGLKFTLNVEGEPVEVSSKEKTPKKGKLKLVFNNSGEPVEI